MNYPTINRNYAKAMQSRLDERIQEECRIAEDLQRKTGCTRTEALKIAKRVMEGQPR